MFPGTAYGVVLNDRVEFEQLGDAFATDPYRAPPVAPVLYIKPRGCVVATGGEVAVPAGQPVVAAATVALLFGRDATRLAAADALGAVAGVALALDLSLPHDSYYRPAVAERCRDGFLPLGPASTMPADLAALTIETLVDDAPVHSWDLSRLLSDAAGLIARISEFMTLAAGDLLLVGLPGDAPRVGAGQAIEARARGLAPLRTRLVEEALA